MHGRSERSQENIITQSITPNKGAQLRVNRKKMSTNKYHRGTSTGDYYTFTRKACLNTQIRLYLRTFSGQKTEHWIKLNSLFNFVEIFRILQQRIYNKNIRNKLIHHGLSRLTLCFFSISQWVMPGPTAVKTFRI